MPQARTFGVKCNLVERTEHRWWYRLEGHQYDVQLWDLDSRLPLNPCQAREDGSNAHTGTPFVRNALTGTQCVKSVHTGTPLVHNAHTGTLFVARQLHRCVAGRHRATT